MLFAPAGLVTLTTDFGQRDSYVGEMKGVMVSLASSLRLIDIAHDLPPQDVAHAGRLVAAAAPRFPVGSVHLVVIDPGVGTGRAAMVAFAGGHAFVAPDNGVLAPVIRRLGGLDAAYLIEGHPYMSAEPSWTFHGRDLFAPSAAALAAGLLKPEELGPALRPTLPLQSEPLSDGAGGWRGELVNVDHFGNLISNIHAEHLSQGDFEVEVAGVTLPLSRTYGEVQEGALLALIGSDGWLEIAERDGSAAERLALSPGSSLWARTRAKR